MPANLYSDRLSLRSLAVDDQWPDWGLDQFHPLPDTDVLEGLKKLQFDFDAWLEYKATMPHNQLDLRTITYPGIEYKLTPAEYQALVTKIKVYPSGSYGTYNVEDFTSPVLCPQQWARYDKERGAFSQRMNWLVSQTFWVEDSFPIPPAILWGSNGLYLQLFQGLVYEPFLTRWRELPDDFWVHLSYCCHQDNFHSVNRGLILVFKAQGRIYPSPYVCSEFNYNEETVKTHDSESLYLPPEFWAWTPPPQEIKTTGMPFDDLTPSEQILVRLIGEQLSDDGNIGLFSLIQTLRIAGIPDQLDQILQSFYQKGYVKLEMDDRTISECVITYHGFREYATHFLPFFPVLRQRVINQVLTSWERDVPSLTKTLWLSPFLINHIFDDLEHMGYLHTYIYPYFNLKRRITYIFPALRHHIQNHPLPPQYQFPTILLGAAPGVLLDIEERVIQGHLLGSTLKLHDKIRLPDHYSPPPRGPVVYQVVALVPEVDLMTITEETRIEVVPSCLIEWEHSTPYTIDLIQSQGFVNIKGIGGNQE